jgi:hypothetical protein
LSVYSDKVSTGVRRPKLEVDYAASSSRVTNFVCIKKIYLFSPAHFYGVVFDRAHQQLLLVEVVVVVFLGLQPIVVVFFTAR